MSLLFLGRCVRDSIDSSPLRVKPSPTGRRRSFPALAYRPVQDSIGPPLPRRRKEQTPLSRLASGNGRVAPHWKCNFVAKPTKMTETCLWIDQRGGLSYIQPGEEKTLGPDPVHLQLNIHGS